MEEEGLASVGGASGPWPPGGGEMAARVRAHDWAATPLGPAGAWPAELRSAAALVLDNAFPAALAWGPGLITLYNDGFRAILGGKHPGALGRPFAEVWSEAWAEIGPVAERALAGRSTFVEDYPLVVDRGAGPERASFTFSYSPVRAADGTVLGMVDTVVETTGKVRLEAGLRASEERYRALATAGSYLVYRMSPDWRLMYRLDGRGVLADTPGPAEDWADAYILPEDRPAVAAAVADAIRDGSLFELEHRVRRADGSVGWVLSRAVPIRGPAGGVAEWFGAASDVTAAREAEAALRQSEGRFRSFAGNTADVLWIADAGGPGPPRLEYLSPAFEAVWGEPRDTVLADLGRWAELVHPEDRGRATAGMARALVGEPFRQEYRIVRPRDGAVRWILDAGFPIRDPDGRVRRVGGIAQDVTARKEAEAVLREGEERLRQFGEASSDVLWTRDAETLRWEYLTPAFEAVYGLGREEALGRDDLQAWAGLILPEDRGRALDAIRRVRGGERVTFEYRVRRPIDGRVRWLRDTDFPIRDADGQVRRIGGVGHDATEEKRAQAVQAVLVAELQHRTRNLLGVVRSLARRSVEPSPGLDEYDARLAALGRVQGFLSRSPLYTVPLAELVGAELEAAGDGASGRATAGGPAVELPGEGVQAVALALHELATNAVKHGALAQPSGRLAVTWRVEADDDGGRRLVVDWRESGVAMPGGGGPPARRGYGSELITEALPYQLGAETELAFGPDGVRCRIVLPAGAFGGGEEEEDAHA